MPKRKPIGALYSDLVKVEGALKDRRPLGQAALVIQNQARLNAHTGRFPTGHLANSIMIGFTEGPNELTAHIGTNVEYAPYVEFGTGPKGMEHHEGISPNVHPTYRTTPWWIHESMIDPNAAEAYHWQYIDTDQGRFYKVIGQPARPYLYPAVRDNEAKVEKVLREAYRKEIRRRVK